VLINVQLLGDLCLYGLVCVCVTPSSLCFSWSCILVVANLENIEFSLVTLLQILVVFCDGYHSGLVLRSRGAVAQYLTCRLL